MGKIYRGFYYFIYNYLLFIIYWLELGKQYYLIIDRLEYNFSCFQEGKENQIFIGIIFLKDNIIYGVGEIKNFDIFICFIIYYLLNYY